MNSNLQNKLQQFQADPPQGVWDKIADALDNSGAFAERLHQYEEQPPAASWTQIEAGLSEQPEPAKVIPLNNRLKKPLRYVAVAAGIAVVLITATLTFRRTKAGDLDTASHTTAPAKKGFSTSDDPQKNTYAVQTGTTTPKEEIQPAGDGVNGSPATQNRETTPATSGSRTAVASTARYLIYNDDDGNRVKVSKKLAEFVNCKDGDAECQQHLRELRQKLAAKATTTDFTGILEMLHQLQQKP